MRQVIITFSLLGSFIIFASTVQLFDVVVMFLLFGIVPGHHEPISARIMLIGYAAAAVGTMGYILRAKVPVLAQKLTSRLKKSYKQLSLRLAQA